jgi:hypothetical protein
MKDMKQTKAETKAQYGLPPKSDAPAGDTYPHGLSVRLDHESLSKLGVNKLPAVGDKLHLHAHAHVTHVSEEHGEGGKSRRHVELQLRKMDLQQKPNDEAEQKEGMKAAMNKALSEAGEPDEGAS